MPERRAVYLHFRIFEPPQIPGQVDLRHDEAQVAQSQKQPEKFSCGGNGAAEKSQPQAKPGQTHMKDVAHCGRRVFVKPAARQHHGDNTRKKQAHEKAQTGSAPVFEGNGHFNRNTQQQPLVGIGHLFGEIGPGPSAEPRHGLLQIIVFPQGGQFRIDFFAGFFQPVEQGQRGRKRCVVLGQHCGEAQAGHGQSLNVFLHFRTEALVVQVFGQAVGQIADALKQALGLAAGVHHGRQYLAHFCNGHGKAAADGLHGVGRVLIGIAQHQKAAGLVHKGLHLFADVEGTVGKGVAHGNGFVVDLFKHAVLAAPDHGPGVVQPTAFFLFVLWRSGFVFLVGRSFFLVGNGRLGIFFIRLGRGIFFLFRFGLGACLFFDLGLWGVLFFACFRAWGRGGRFAAGGGRSSGGSGRDLRIYRQGGRACGGFRLLALGRALPRCGGRGAGSGRGCGIGNIGGCGGSGADNSSAGSGAIGAHSARIGGRSVGCQCGGRV